MEKRRLAILGSTGSIGTQALDVVRQHRDLFEVVLLTANNNSGLLIEQAREFSPAVAVICNEEKYREVADALKPCGTEALCGMDAVCGLMSDGRIDTVLTALVGFCGLRPTIAAIKAGKTIALANKETLVAAGGLVMGLAARHGARILPVDSEHSAIFQCLAGSCGNRLRRIHLTASGGPFRTWTKEQMAHATMGEALHHPKWNMGAKITIDSATMMNKGFEMIEARWLFDTNPADINIVVHPQSIIHSMVEYEDGSVIAQLGSPDMREPIQFALSYPERLALNNRKLDFASIGSLTFEAPDMEKFPCMALAFEAIGRGGNIPCAMNAANEAAVAAFLHGEISYFEIAETVGGVMASTPFIAEPGLDEIFNTDSEALTRAGEFISRLKRK